MNNTLFYTTTLGPPVGDPTAMYAPPLRYKRGALAVRYRLERTQHTSSLELSRGKAIQHIVDVGYYAPAARTTLNLAVFIVFLSEIELGLANPRVHTLWLGRVPSATRLWFAAPRQPRYFRSKLPSSVGKYCWSAESVRAIYTLR